jgi:hypothetical protein
LITIAQAQQQRHAAWTEQIHAAARSAAHVNSLLKRTNQVLLLVVIFALLTRMFQLATDAISKNSIFVGNLKRLEEYVLEGDPGPKKLASLVYRKLAAESFISFTLAANMSYNSMC